MNAVKRMTGLWYFYVVFVVGLLWLAGCASLPATRVDPVTVPHIIDMSKAGVPNEEIIAKISASGTIYRLKASQLAGLKERGVSNQVIDYMQQTYLNAVRRDQALAERSRWTQGADRYWYGGRPYGWHHHPNDFIRRNRMRRLDRQRK